MIKMKKILFLLKNILIKIFLIIICGYVCLIFIKNALIEKSKNSKIIWFIGARSAGHIVPLFSIANKIKNNDKFIKKIFITTNTEIDKKSVKNLNLENNLHFEFDLPNLPKKNLYSFFKYIPLLIKSIYFSLKILFNYTPNKIIATGGYLSYLICKISSLFEIDIYLYSLDAIPGKAVSKISYFAKEINIVFESSLKYFSKKILNKIRIIDMPIRFLESDLEDKNIVKKRLNAENKKVIFVMGGSQGSEEINNLILDNLNNLNENKKNNLFLIHQTGKNDFYKIKEFYLKNKIDNITFDYSSNLKDYYNAADIIISRAGASSLYEIVFFKKDAFIFPLKGEANDHQLKNALNIQNKYKFIKIKNNLDLNLI